MWTLAQHSSANSAQLAAPVLFYALAALTALSAWAIVLSQNIVRMSVYLLLTLIGVAGLYFMLEAELLAAIQLIVYAGGTLILIVFGVMLTSKNPFMQLKPKGWELGVGIGIGVMLAALLLIAMLFTPGLIGHDNGPVDYSRVDMIGRALLSQYLVAFEVAAVLLLVVMVGAAFLARKRSS